MGSSIKIMTIFILGRILLLDFHNRSPCASQYQHALLIISIQERIENHKIGWIMERHHHFGTAVEEIPSHQFLQSTHMISVKMRDKQ